jgi:hypothetical protein
VYTNKAERYLPSAANMGFDLWGAENIDAGVPIWTTRLSGRSEIARIVSRAEHPPVLETTHKLTTECVE